MIRRLKQFIAGGLACLVMLTSSGCATTRTLRSSCCLEEKAMRPTITPMPPPNQGAILFRREDTDD